jgi:hypothetical protein
MNPGEVLFVLSLLVALLAVAVAMYCTSRILMALNVWWAFLCATSAVVSLIWL